MQKICHSFWSCFHTWGITLCCVKVASIRQSLVSMKRRCWCCGSVMWRDGNGNDTQQLCVFVNHKRILIDFQINPPPDERCRFSPFSCHSLSVYCLWRLKAAEPGGKLCFIVHHVVVNIRTPHQRLGAASLLKHTGSGAPLWVCFVLICIHWKTPHPLCQVAKALLCQISSWIWL